MTTHDHGSINVGRVGRRRMLQGMGAAGLAIVFASACRSGDDDSGATLPPTDLTGNTAGGGGTTTVTAALETASTAMPAGTNPFDDYSYANAATGTEVHIWVQDGVRYIEANGLPDHETGVFPNGNNPNAISEQSYSFEVPADPRATGTSTANGILDVFGIAINGVVFDPGAAEFWNNDFNSGWQLEPMSSQVNLGEDRSNAHVQPTGGYHYHGMPEGMIAGESGTDHSPLIGFAADGFPIYARYGYADASNPSSGIVTLESSYRVKSGTRPDGPGGSYDGSYVADYEYASGLGDLDENNGRSGITPEYPGGTYHYVITDDFPFIPRGFAGSPDPGFARGVPGGAGGAGSAGGGRPGR